MQCNTYWLEKIINNAALAYTRLASTRCIFVICDTGARRNGSLSHQGVNRLTLFYCRAVIKNKNRLTKMKKNGSLMMMRCI